MTSRNQTGGRFPDFDLDVEEQWFEKEVPDQDKDGNFEDLEDKLHKKLSDANFK